MKKQKKKQSKIQKKNGEIEQPEGWIRYYDSTQQAYYWYNHETGESKWDQEQESKETPNHHDSTSYYIEDEKENGPDIEQNISLLSHTADTLKEDGMRDVDDLQEETRELVVNSDFLYYWRFVNCNAIFIESPCCVIESMIRAIILSFYGIGYIIYHLIISKGKVIFTIFSPPTSQNQNPVRTKLLQIIHDIIITLLIGCLLCIPGYILFIYRRFDPSNEWDLLPLPLLGTTYKFDCRRFATLTVFCSAYHARNVTDMHAILSTAALNPKNNQSNRLTEAKEFWQGSIVYFPREVLQAISRMTQQRIDIQ